MADFKVLKKELLKNLITSAENTLDDSKFQDLNDTENFLDALYEGLKDLIDISVDEFDWEN